MGGALKKEAERTELPSLPSMPCLQARMGPSERTKFVGNLNLDFLPSKTVRNKYLLLKSPSLWYLVIVSFELIEKSTGANYYNECKC